MGQGKDVASPRPSHALKNKLYCRVILPWDKGARLFYPSPGFLTSDESILTLGKVASIAQVQSFGKVTEVSIQPSTGRSWGDKHTNQQVKGILCDLGELPTSSISGWPGNRCHTSRMGKGKAFWNRINWGTSRPGADLWSRVRVHLAGTSMD